MGAAGTVKAPGEIVGILSSVRPRDGELTLEIETAAGIVVRGRSNTSHREALRTALHRRAAFAGEVIWHASDAQGLRPAGITVGGVRVVG